MATDSQASLPFLCVCGETIQVSAGTGGNCDACGRKYSGHAVSLSMTMTVGNPAAATLIEESDEMVGHSLDHFKIIDRLGGGGMGTVYRAMDESLQRYVAIKVIRRGAQGANETKHVEGLLQEARAQARVNHANVVHIYFVSRDERLPYLAMELVPGITLSERIEQGPIEYGEVLAIGLQIGQALRESTQFDIVHGDIKPSNILLHGEVAKLSDFGLAQRISQSDPATGKVTGTPNYMAPEVCRGEPATAQSDMYSFGVMLFEMTFGRLPYSFDDSSIESRLNAHQSATPEFPVAWPTEIPETWGPFLEKLLQKDPADRFESWDDLIVAMRSRRPLKPVAAGGFQRGIAWGLDLLVLAFAQVLIGASLLVAGLVLFPESTLFTTLSILSLPVVPAFVTWWVSQGGLLPGKMLMQLRVVDRHGLGLRPRVLARRSIVQYLPIWFMPLAWKTGSIEVPDFIWKPIGAGLGLFLLVDILLAIFRGGSSLHDQLFNTRVVLLDSRDEE